MAAHAAALVQLNNDGRTLELGFHVTVLLQDIGLLDSFRFSELGLGLLQLALIGGQAGLQTLDMRFEGMLLVSCFGFQDRQLLLVTVRILK